MRSLPFIYNVVEIGLWSAIGIGFLFAAMKHPGAARLRCSFAAIAFLLFAVSDAVELQTGAWWKPWWLFVWKALCAVSLLGLYIDNVRSRLRNRH